MALYADLTTCVHCYSKYCLQLDDLGHIECTQVLYIFLGTMRAEDNVRIII